MGYQPDKCYTLAVIQGIWALPDIYTLCPQEVGHTYQAKPSFPCYNYYFNWLSEYRLKVVSVHLYIKVLINRYSVYITLVLFDHKPNSKFSHSYQVFPFSTWNFALYLLKLYYRTHKFLHQFHYVKKTINTCFLYCSFIYPKLALFLALWYRWYLPCITDYGISLNL